MNANTATAAPSTAPVLRTEKDDYGRSVTRAFVGPICVAALVTIPKATAPAWGRYLVTAFAGPQAGIPGVYFDTRKEALGHLAELAEQI